MTADFKVTLDKSSEIIRSVEQACLELIRKHNLSVEALTEQQLADAIRQAIDSGDFQRHVSVGGGQQVLYIPGFGIEELRNQYNELQYAVRRVHEGESRHETALRYIREAENIQHGPDKESK